MNELLNRRYFAIAPKNGARCAKERSEKTNVSAAQRYTRPERLEIIVIALAKGSVAAL